MSGGSSRVGLGGDTGGGRPNGAVAAPNGGTSATPGLRAASGISKPEADVWYLNEDGDTATGLLALDGGATVAGNPLVVDPAPDNTLTWGPAGLKAPPLTIPPEYVTEDELAAEGFLTAATADALFLTPAEGDAAYATLGHTHPSEESGPWRFQDTVGGTPGSGYLRTNTGALASAGQLLISRTTQDGYDIPPPGWGLQADDTIYIQDRDDSTKWVRYVALEPLVRFPTYATGLVAVSGSAGSTIANGQIIQVTFSLAGGGGGGGEAVTSVNGETGAVVLDAADVGALTQTQGDARYLPLSSQSHNHTSGDGSGVLSNEEHDGYSQYTNLGADASTPGTNTIRLYAKDNGAGVATLYYRTESGEIYELPTLTSGGGGGSGAPSNASYITTTAENKLSQEKVLGTAVIMSGLLSARPAFGTAGRLYLATDTDLVYRDTGSAWETFATRAAGGGGDFVETAGDTMTGALTLQVGGTTTARLYGAGSPAPAPAASTPAGSNREVGVRFSSSSGGTLTAVRWYRAEASPQTAPTAVSLYDTTSTASPVWTTSALTPFADTAVGWKQVEIAVGSRPTLVAGRLYTLSYSTGAVNHATLQSSYTAVPDAGMTYSTAVSTATAGAYPGTTQTQTYWIDPVVATGTGSSTAAGAGSLRLANAAAVGWRNAANSSDLTQEWGAADRLSFKWAGTERLAVDSTGQLHLPTPTTTTSATGGSATALPAQPVGYLSVTIAGTVRKIPYYA